MQFNNFSNSILLLVFTLGLSSCDGNNPFEKRVDTSIQANVTNLSSQKLTTYAVAHEYYSANNCTSNGYSKSAEVDFEPGQTAQVDATINCNTHVRTNLVITNNTNYDTAYVEIMSYDIWNKLTLGLQFQISDEDHQNSLTIQLVGSSSAPIGAYSHFWNLAPNGQSLIAWLKPLRSPNSGVGRIYFSIPKGVGNQLPFIEFADSLGIDKFGFHQVYHEFGTYRSIYEFNTGTTIWINDTSNTSVICDDIGCNI